MKSKLTAALSTAFNCAILAFIVVALSACSGGGGGDSGGGQTSASPTAPTANASPGNGHVALGWNAVGGAISYNVYTSTISPVTKASTKTSVATAGTTLSGLVNGMPVFAAVTAVGEGGESALSNEVCAVPTAASTTGLTLYDPLCANALDGAKWQTPLFGRAVVNGAMVVSARATNMEPFGSRGLAYRTPVILNAGAQRVSTLQVNMSVAAASAARTGGAEIEAHLRLAYQPPAARLNFPVGSSDLLTVQVGLRDDGSGLRAFREISHCDNESCTAVSSGGIAFSDPAGFSGDAPASYDTAYVISAALDESTGVFSWSISGGGLNLAGTANPAAYLAGNSSWTALGADSLAATGFLNAGVTTRVLDNRGGSSGQISAGFDDVRAGFNGLAATLWDDFSGAGGNSGPTELSAAKWTLHPGSNSMSLSAGNLTGHAQATTPNTASLSVFPSVLFAEPAAINTIQSDFTVTACSNTLSGTNRVGIAAGIYNDGTAGTTAPDINQPGSRVGDIGASLFLDCTLGDVRLQITRCDTNASQTILSDSGNAVVPKGSASVIGNTHTLMMKWDPSAHLLTFQADGQTPVTVDPTAVNAHMLTAAPFVKSPNVPSKNLSWFLFVPNGPSGGATASVDFKANNVFTAP